MQYYVVNLLINALFQYLQKHCRVGELPLAHHDVHAETPGVHARFVYSSVPARSAVSQPPRWQTDSHRRIRRDNVSMIQSWQLGDIRSITWQFSKNVFFFLSIADTRTASTKSGKTGLQDHLRSRKSILTSVIFWSNASRQDSRVM